MLNIDLNLIKKYDRPGPRYTSYPTAPHFNDSFTAEKYLNEIIRTNNESVSPELSLYYHLPFCDTLCYFCGCNMIITRNRDRIREYIKYLKNEIDLLRAYIVPGRKVAQLHWGGGTPTHLDPDEIADLISFINRSFEIKPDAEEGCEIDPRGLTKEHLSALRSGGFNRISMGVQDFNDKVCNQHHHRDDQCGCRDQRIIPSHHSPQECRTKSRITEDDLRHQCAADHGADR